MTCGAFQVVPKLREPREGFSSAVAEPPVPWIWNKPKAGAAVCLRKTFHSPHSKFLSLHSGGLFRNGRWGTHISRGIEHCFNMTRGLRQTSEQSLKKMSLNNLIREDAHGHISRKRQRKQTKVLTGAVVLNHVCLLYLVPVFPEFQHQEGFKKEKYAKS